MTRAALKKGRGRRAWLGVLIFEARGPEFSEVNRFVEEVEANCRLAMPASGKCCSRGIDQGAVMFPCSVLNLREDCGMPHPLDPRDAIL